MCSRDAFVCRDQKCTRHLSLAGAATSIIFVATNMCLSRQKMCFVFVQPRREAGDVSRHPPVWNLRAVIRFPFPISSLGFFLCLVLLLFLSCNVSANGPFSFLYPPRKLKYFSFCMAFVWLLYGFRMAFVWLLYGFCMAFVWLLYGFCMALVEQPGGDSR